MKIAIFVEGSFIPSMDGASVHFSGLARSLYKSGIKVCVFHCYRGWSNLELISKEEFKTYILPPHSYYGNYSLLSQLVKNEHPDIIQVNDLETALYLGAKLKKDFRRSLVFDSIFVSSLLAEQLGASKQEINNLKLLENHVGRVCDSFICFTKDDSKMITRLFNIKDSEVYVVPCGIDLSDVSFWGPNFENKTLLFLGNMFFEPNTRSVRIIMEQIFLSLKNDIDGLKVLFVGDCPDALVRKYKSNGISFLGRVDNLNNVFRKSTIALAPILETTGIRVKILHYLGAGIPVISTLSAAAGLEDEGVIFRTEISNFVGVIEDIIYRYKKGDLVARARKGREIVESKYNWEKIGLEAKKNYYAIKRKPIKNFNPEFAIKKMKEPFWLKETIEKGRFRDFTPGQNFLFARAGSGNLEYFYA